MSDYFLVEQRIFEFIKLGRNIFFLFKSFLFYLIRIQFFITLKLKKRKEKTLHKAEISKKTKQKK